MRLPDVLERTVPLVIVPDRPCRVCGREAVAQTPVDDGLVCFGCATGRWLMMQWFGVPQ